MSSKRSGAEITRQSRQYGHAAEQHVIDEYGLEMDHDSHHDARRSSGEPVEIKAAKIRMNNGREGRVLIRQQAHRRLRQADGWYAFVAYRARGQGIEVIETTMRRARAVRIDSWQDLDREPEKQIPVSDVL